MFQSLICLLLLFLCLSRSAMARSVEYWQFSLAAKTSGGNHFNAFNQTFNPATHALFGFSQAFEGLGLEYHNQGQRLLTGQRWGAFAQGVAGTVQTVAAAAGVRGAPPTFRGVGVGGGGVRPPPLPASPSRGLQVRVHPRAGELGGVNISGANAARKGETKFTRKGRSRHANWNPGPGYEKEFELPSGRRVDAINFEKQHIKEF